MLYYLFLKVGDPLEKAAIKGIDWIYTSDEKAMSRR
jgi:cation-transporting ATPase 13A1